jgi:hypothetical protein
MKKQKKDKFKTTKPSELYWDDPQNKQDESYESPMSNRRQFTIHHKSKKDHKPE